MRVSPSQGGNPFLHSGCEGLSVGKLRNALDLDPTRMALLLPYLLVPTSTGITPKKDVIDRVMFDQGVPQPGRSET